MKPSVVNSRILEALADLKQELVQVHDQIHRTFELTAELARAVTPDAAQSASAAEGQPGAGQEQPTPKRGRSRSLADPLTR